MFEDEKFWVALAFVVTVAIIVWKGGRGILKTIDDKTAAIKAELDEATRLREEAQRTLAEYQRKHQDAATEAEAIIAQAREEAELLANDAKKRLEESLQRREQQAMDRIAQAEANAEADVRRHAADLAVSIGRSVLSTQLKGAPGDKLVDDAIEKLPQHLH